MKRSISIALILALLGSIVFYPSFAEDLEIIFEDVDTFVSEVDLSDASDIIVESIDETHQETFSEAVEESVSDITDDNSVPGTTESSAQVATGIELNASSICIGVKEKYSDLAVAALPEGSPLPAVSWRSSNKKVAKVSSSGVITGVKKGTATIYAKMADSDVEVKCKVTVKYAPKKVSIKPASLTLSAGMTFQLQASVPSKYASGSYIYSSSKKSVATVDSNGLITALKAGSATITVSTYNGKKAKCKVKVMGKPASVAFPDSVIPLAVGQTASLNACALTRNNEATPSTITYAIDESSPDAGCTTLDEATGTIDGVRRGVAVIRGEAHNGAVGYCEVEVDVAPASVSLNYSSIIIGVTETYVGLLADLTPPKGQKTCAQSVVWSSSDTKVATVDPMSGSVTGLKCGNAVITATVPGGKTATCNLSVLKAPTKNSLSISPSIGALYVGQTGKYNVTLSKGYAGSFTYESSDTEIATIDNSGVVTAISPGNVTITVSTYNGIKKTAKLEVYGESTSASDESSKSCNEEKIQYLLKIALQKQGKPYVYGSFGPNSFDCSGFVYWCYKQINITLKDSAYKQGYDTRYPKLAHADLKPGDLVFFNTVNDSDLSDHSGLYLGNGQFIHASSSAKMVIISNLNSGYYLRNFSWGRRVLN